MFINNQEITMTPSEWEMFSELTFAPWRPRTIKEFNAMCDLGMARHFHENTEGKGVLKGVACDCIKFGEDGVAHFPPNRRKQEYIKVFGESPTPEQLAAFERGQLPMPGTVPKLSVVPSTRNNEE